MKTNYPAKVLLAWSEAIAGNRKIREWLMKNGYRELGVFVFGLRNKDDAKDWLLKNKFEHLAATISGAEGNPNAVAWLRKFNFDVLANVAMVGHGDQKALKWLIDNNHREMAIVAKQIEAVKDEIESDNNDAHKISQE